MSTSNFITYSVDGELDRDKIMSEYIRCLDIIDKGFQTLKQNIHSIRGALDWRGRISGYGDFQKNYNEIVYALNRIHTFFGKDILNNKSTMRLFTDLEKFKGDCSNLLESIICYGDIPGGWDYSMIKLIDDAEFPYQFKGRRPIPIYPHT